VVLFVQYQSALIYGVVVGLLALGFRLTHEASGYMNIGHSVNLGIGMGLGFVVIQQLNIAPLLGSPFSFILTGLFNMVVYLLFYQWMEKQEHSEAMITLFGIVSMYIAEHAFTVLEYLLRLWFPSDYWCGPSPTGFSDQHLHYRATSTGVFMGGFIEIVLVFMCVILFYRWMYHNKQGALLRATGENPVLVEVSGISTSRVKIITWFIAGGLAGVAGILLPFVFKGQMGRDIQLFVPMVAAAVCVESRDSWVAGVSGLVVGFLSFVIRNWMVAFIGLWTAEYWNTVPLLILIMGLLIKDRRRFSPNWENLHKRSSSRDQLYTGTLQR